MRNRTFRTITTTLCIVMLTSGPIKAGPVVVSDVIQYLSNYQNPPELRLRTLRQSSTPLLSDQQGETPQGVKSKSASTSGQQTQNPTESLFNGLTVASTDQQGVVVIDQGDVDGTICDCGEITIAGGGFPKWPFLFLAVIPLFFIHDCEDCKVPNPSPTPIPTPPSVPTPPGVPEPGSLIMLGSGLAAFAAGLRRRSTKAKLARRTNTVVEG